MNGGKGIYVGGALLSILISLALYATSYTSFSAIVSSRKWSGGGIGHPCQRTQKDGGGVEELHPLSIWNI